jgi:hypothetical protein
LVLSQLRTQPEALGYAAREGKELLSRRQTPMHAHELYGPDTLLIIMSKHEDGALILKLYELRREATMRKARDWYFAEFFPETMADYNAALFGEHSGHLRMVTTYWDMAAALVNHGAIDLELFNDANGEHISVFSKIEHLIGDVRATYGAQYLANLEKLIDDTKDGRERVAATRERMRGMRAKIAAVRAGTATS